MIAMDRVRLPASGEAGGACSPSQARIEMKRVDGRPLACHKAVTLAVSGILIRSIINPSHVRFRR